MTLLRVWHIPQIPGTPFHVSVESIDEGRKILDVLADYDLFQYQQRIKPDYANAGGIEYHDAGDDEWYSVDPDEDVL